MYLLYRSIVSDESMYDWMQCFIYVSLVAMIYIGRIHDSVLYWQKYKAQTESCAIRNIDRRDGISGSRLIKYEPSLGAVSNFFYELLVTSLPRLVETIPYADSVSQMMWVSREHFRLRMFYDFKLGLNEKRMF